MLNWKPLEKYLLSYVLLSGCKKTYVETSSLFRKQWHGLFEFYMMLRVVERGENRLSRLPVW